MNGEKHPSVLSNDTLEKDKLTSKIFAAHAHVQLFAITKSQLFAHVVEAWFTPDTGELANFMFTPMPDR
jgi:hypothetical protein